MGAARLGQAASDAVIVTVRRPLTCADVVTWPVWPVAHCIRIEGSWLHPLVGVTAPMSTMDAKGWIDERYF